MSKVSRKYLLSRRAALLLGISAISMFATLGLTKAKALSYLIYPFTRNIDDKSRKFSVVGSKSLKDRARAKGLIYGGFPQANERDFEIDRKLQSRFIQECASMTIGCYWITTRPSLDTFDFTSADYFAEFAIKNKMQLRGHPLVWHEALPPWFERTLNSQNAEQILTNHLQTIVKRYAGKMYSWDVLNEAIEINDRRSDHLRQTPWLKFLGADYIDQIFRIVASIDPQAKLIYNEYGLEYDTPEDEAKRGAVLNLLRKLKSQGTPIYALGIQAHLSGEQDISNLSKFSIFLREVASLGFKIVISEMDVADNHLPLDLIKRDRIIAGIYEDFLSVALAEKAVTSVTTWGLSDRYTWLADFKPRRDRAAVRPLPFDRDSKPKSARNALARAFDRAPVRRLDL